MNLRTKTTQNQAANQPEDPQQATQASLEATQAPKVDAPPTGLRNAAQGKATTQVRTRAQALYWAMSQSNGYRMKGERAHWAGNPPPAWMHKTVDAILAKYGLDESTTNDKAERAKDYTREAICRAADAIYLHPNETPEKAVITGVSTKTHHDFEEWAGLHPRFAFLVEEEAGRASNETRAYALESAFHNWQFEVGAHLCKELREGAGAVNPNIPLDGQGMPRAHTDLGGYPLYYLAKDGGVLSPEAVKENLDLTNDPDDPQWYIVGADVNYEDPNLICEHTGERIPSAYAEDDPSDDGAHQLESANQPPPEAPETPLREERPYFSLAEQGLEIYEQRECFGVRRIADQSIVLEPEYSFIDVATNHLGMLNARTAKGDRIAIDLPSFLDDLDEDDSEDEATQPEPALAPGAERILARAQALMDRLTAQNVAEWVGLHYSRNYSAESPEKQAEWRERYKDSHYGDDWLDDLVYDLEDNQAATAMNQGPDHKADETLDAHSREGSAINNGGALAQIQFILTQVSPQEAWELIAKELGVETKEGWIYPGAEVFWNDPDDGACSCHATVQKIVRDDFDDDAEGAPLDPETMVILRKEDGTTLEVLAGELS